jgi:hypothetical protein
MSTLACRVLGTARLEASIYEEVESDRAANWQAVGIVLVSSLAAAFGMGVKTPEEVAAALAIAVATWIFWVLLTLFIGSVLLRGKRTNVDFGQLFRTTGFSASPGVLRALGIIPVMGWFFFLAATIWMLFAFVVAVRQALDYADTRRVVAVCALGWLIHGGLLFAFVLTAM